MERNIAHRGPDGSGIWEGDSGEAVLIHRRLSVIDLESGGQPMTDVSGRYTIVFNGEIYNYRILRRKLEARGHLFHTSSDTEVLLHQLIEKGVGGISELRGMFAFALWDSQNRRLLLARDPLGKKPLFYRISGSTLVFSSSLSSLEKTFADRPSIDHAALRDFLLLGYIPAPKTIYQGVNKLVAGNLLEFEAHGARVKQYHTFLDQKAEYEGSYSEALDEMDSLLGKAVTYRLQSDVPLGVFLSGGVDSSLVTAIASKRSDQQLETFSIGFSHSEFDESQFAAEVSHYLGTRHRSFRGELNLLDLLPKVIDHSGEPFADATILPTWLLAERCRKHVTVVLAGDGGDEGFAGYNWYFTAERLKRMGRWLPGGMRPLLTTLGDNVSRSGSPPVRQLGRALRLIGLADSDRFQALRIFLSPAEERELFSEELYSTNRDGGQDLIRTLFLASAGPSFRRMRTTDISSYLADCLLPKVDLATMAHGLEARAPLLDQEFLSFALTLPDAWMKDAGGRKPLLRDLLARYLPRRLFERPKQGFTVPLRPWLLTDLKPRMESLVTSEVLMDTGWFREEGIERLVKEHAAGVRDHSQRVFNLFVLKEWLSTR